MRTLFLAAVVAGCAAWAAPVRAESPDRQAARPAVSDRGDSKQSWEDYRLQARKDLDVIEAKIAKLENQAKTAGADARDRLQAQATTLRAKKNEADRMMNQLATATADARKELRSKLDRALRALKKSIRKAEAKLPDRT